MKRELVALILVVALSGCAPQSPSANTQSQDNTAAPGAAPTPPAPAEDEVVATVRGDPITMKQLQGPLLEAYGLNILLALVQLDLAQQEAVRQGISITTQDVEAEANQTLINFRTASNQQLGTSEPATEPSDQTLTPIEHDRLLGMLLTGQRFTRTEFYIAMQCNALLRKLVEPDAQLLLTEDNIHQRFNAIYGERARVRYIRQPDMKSISAIEKDLSAGRTFEEEVRLHAYDSIGRPSSGEYAPFSRGDLNFPSEFKMVAFGLKPGGVSDPVQINDSIYLVQLIELIPPRNAKYEDYKDAVKRDLYQQTMQFEMKKKLAELGNVARQTMEIKNPILSRQWDLTLRNADELRAQLLKQQQAATTQPTTAPAAAGAAAATAPTP